VVKDGWTLLTSPTRWDATDWLIAGGAVGATVGAMFLDNSVRTRMQDFRAGNGNAANNLANSISNLGLIAPMVGTATNYIIGQVTDDERAKRRAADAVEAAVLVNGLYVYPMKFLLGRSRPSTDLGPWSYNPFNISGSFPSFHATQAFTAAAVITEYWDNPWLSVLAYGLAASVGVARMYQDNHWLSDVVASAAIGITVGKSVVAINNQRRDSKLSVVPLAAPGTWGAAVQYRY
jgi:membrane-associated phospholipid phosphatase